MLGKMGSRSRHFWITRFSSSEMFGSAKLAFASFHHCSAACRFLASRAACWFRSRVRCSRYSRNESLGADRPSFALGIRPESGVEVRLSRVVDRNSFNHSSQKKGESLHRLGVCARFLRRAGDFFRAGRVRLRDLSQLSYGRVDFNDALSLEFERVRVSDLRQRSIHFQGLLDHRGEGQTKCCRKNNCYRVVVSIS
jgi:hypothetical protein